MEQSQDAEKSKQKAQGYLVVQINLEDYIKIGDNIFIQVKQQRGKSVRVAVTAPRDIRIERIHKTDG